MPIVEIDNLAASGLVKDVPSYQLAPEVLSSCLNARYVDTGIERMKGWSSTFGTPTIAPSFAIAVKSSAGSTYWVYASLTKGAVWDGTSHTDITRTVGGDYSAGASENWNGFIFNGVPIINNGVDDPQFWATLSPATKLADLTNWPASTSAKMFGAFTPHMIAINVTKSGTVYPHLVKWSHPADPGSVPSSWDETDATKDTGETDLPDVNSGVLKSMLPLKDAMFLYKEEATWRMKFIGGRFVFSFTAFLTTSGILGPNCVATLRDGLRHVVATQDDFIVHNGTSAQSILQGRMRKYVFDNLDPASYETSFVFDNPLYDEAWFCYPSIGASYPNRAVIWNYKTGQIGALSEVDGITFRRAALGPVEAVTSEAWSTGSDLWSDDTGPWSELDRRRIIACGTGDTKFFLLDDGQTRNGATFSAEVGRENLALVGKDRQGHPLVDYTSRKLFRRFWLKAQGGPVDVSAGQSQLVNGPVSWTSAKTFDPGANTNPAVGLTVDVVRSGKALSWKVADPSGSQADWRVDGFGTEIQKLGMF